MAVPKPTAACSLEKGPYRVQQVYDGTMLHVQGVVVSAAHFDFPAIGVSEHSY
jgi:hypothetical protein